MKKTVFPLLIGLLIHSIPAFCISEQNYKSVFEKEVLPFYEQKAKHTFFEGVDSVPIHFAEFIRENEKGAVVLLPGQSESAIKYAETIYDLYQAGYSVYALDHRGQGLSGRMLPDPQKSHVADFNDYVLDAEQFLKKYVTRDKHRRIFLLAHSMGGLIGTLVAQDLPEFFDSAVLSAPMLSFQTKPYPGFFAKFIASILPRKKYAPGRGPFNPDAKFERNTLTNCEVRFRVTHDLMKLYPENQVGGPTVGWVHASFKATKKVRKFSLPLSTLVLQAGEDEWVKNSSENSMCGKSAKCKIVRFDHAKHEILTEKDQIRNQVLGLIQEQFL